MVEEAGVRSWVLPGAADPPGSVQLLQGEGGGGELPWLRPDPGEITTLAREMRAAREEVLLGRDTLALVDVLGRVGERFLDPVDPLRRAALEGLPGWSGVSPEMALAVVDGMARDWTRPRLLGMVESDFPDPRALQSFVPGRQPGQWERALGDPLLLQIVSGSVPGVSATALLRGLLVRSATVVKPGRGDLLLPLLWARGIREEDPSLGRVLGIHYWPGGAPLSVEVERGWLQEADRVVVYGGPEAVGAAREQLPPGVPLVAYPHRISVGLLGREWGGAPGCDRLLREAARALSLFDGRGCVTPQLLFVEEGGRWSGEDWGTHLAAAMEAEASALPPGRLSADEAGRIQQLRGTAEMRGAAGRGDRVWRGEGTRWTVILDPGEGLRGSCPGRVVRVVPVGDLELVPRRLAELAPHLQTVALEVEDARRPALAEALARSGVPRITTLAGAPWPPPWWHHDGEGPLLALVRWTDLEEAPRPGG